MTVELEKTTDHEDGSATFTFTMSHDEMIQFAQIGLKQALMLAAKHIVEPEPIGSFPFEPEPIGSFPFEPEPDYYEEVLALRAKLAKVKRDSA